MTNAQLIALQPGQQLHFQPPGSQPQVVTVQSNDGNKVIFIYVGGSEDGATLTFVYGGLHEIRELIP